MTTLPPLPVPIFAAVRLGMTPDQSMAYTESEMRAYGEACAEAERERCAKVCEALIRRQAHVNPAAAWYEATHSCAAAIRGA